MDRLIRFIEESPIAERVSLPAHIVVRELTLSSAAVKRMMESGSFAPLGGHVCDLEVGGRRVASGRVVWRDGGWFFKTASILPTGKTETNQSRLRRSPFFDADVKDSGSRAAPDAAVYEMSLLRLAAAAAARPDFIWAAMKGTSF